MFSILKIEWLKIRKYPAFWILFLIVAFTYPGINLIFANLYSHTTGRKDAAGSIVKMILGNPFAFPETWHSVAYFSSFFVLIPSILVIMLISNEFQFKTSRQNVIDGWSRTEFITGKLLDVLIVTIVATLMYGLVAAWLGFKYTDDINISRWAESIQFIPLFMLQTFAQLSIAFLFGFLLRKAFLALGVFIFWLIAESILKGFLLVKDIPLREYLPMEISSRLLPAPNFFSKFNSNSTAYQQSLADINPHILLTLLLTAGVWVLCYYLHDKRDL